MKKSQFTEEGVCHASIRTEAEVGQIKTDLEGSDQLELVIRWLEGVKDPTRFKLIYLLFSQKQLCVCDLANILDVSSSAISQHLRKLKDMDLVCSQRQNQTLYYRLKNDKFSKFVERLIQAEPNFVGQ